MFPSFESVIQYYYDKAQFSNLSDFSKRNLNPIKEWLKNELTLKNGKDNNKSSIIRRKGNAFYKEKSLKKCLESYNFSICCAQDSSEEYFLAMANRSATTLDLGRYEDCLKDVETCLSSSIYPKDLRPKLLLRKGKCLEKLDITSMGDSLKVSKNERQQNENMYELPLFEEGENPKFAYASSRIDIRYNEQKGRYVVAEQTIPKGDIIFIEKAFAFANIFDEHSRMMNMFKCYQCLKNTYSGVPCRYCSKCIFCDSECRNKSWEESHRWECQGMLGNIWCHLGIAFPAFRALLKGFNSSFEEIETNDVECFGNKQDNYPFFNSLIFNKNNKHLDVSIMSLTVSTYLREYTNYFDWLLSQKKNSKLNIDHIVTSFESQLVKHILQFQNNSSIIEHWLEGETLPLDKEPVACGIFPSVSIMNHSCKPNITNYFVCDTIVVKALETIKENEEIYNCYGIYYRDMNRNERQNNCSQLYQFQCRCVICSDPTKEMDAFDSFKCPQCNIPIINSNELPFLCRDCGSKLDFSILMHMYQSIELGGENELVSLVNFLESKKRILNRYHADVQNIYFKLYKLHEKRGNYKCMLECFEEWFRVEKVKVGQDVQLFGVLLYEVGSVLLSKLGTTHVENKKMLSKAQRFMREAIRICKLHYPPYIVEKILTENNCAIKMWLETA
ncbi:SET and MYND domain-containing protein 4-like isoform X2 [Coccinella septempunctata]|uniref:SET and MYND domain-containing protein 4-like isoform X2 n=1 Tax=Coccinella septempunctata TaxID=41139 RepID=UPI001D07E015|nr:SET and MYND domain-containing protein 4-like isoform X2 [Coccinella septempunctata]